MKKILILFLLASTVSLPAIAQTPSIPKPKKLERNVQQHVLQADTQTRSIDAHNRATFDAQIRVRSRFVNQIQTNDQVIDKDCSAVKIDSNWLIASLRCRGTVSEVTAYLHDRTEITKKIESRKIDWIKIEGLEVKKRNYFIDESSKIILIRTNLQHDLAEKLAKRGNVVANMLIAQNPVALLKTVKEAFINRERYCLPGRCSDSVEIEQYCADNKCYKVEWEMIDGDSGDPLFLLSKNHGKAEFLAGLNDAEYSSGYDISGRFYRVFDSKTLEFMRKIIGNRDPEAFRRISQHIVDENSF